MTDSHVYAGAAMLGIAAGVRSMVPPAMVRRFAHTRRSIDRQTGIPDPAIALVEDTIAATSGWLLYRSLQADTDNPVGS